MACATANNKFKIKNQTHNNIFQWLYLYEHKKNKNKVITICTHVMYFICMK